MCFNGAISKHNKKIKDNIVKAFPLHKIKLTKEDREEKQTNYKTDKKQLTRWQY